MEYTRNRQTPKNYGGSYTPPNESNGQEAEQPRKFVLKEKIREMIQYGLPLVDRFPRRNRKLADIMRDSMLEMYRLATRLERKYYKKTTIEDLDVELAVLKEFVIIASDKDFYRGTRMAGPNQGQPAQDQKAKGFAPPLTMHERDVWSRYNKEIGNMIGGYKKAFENKGLPK